MTGLCGWLQTPVGAAPAAAVLSDMSAGLTAGGALPCVQENGAACCSTGSLVRLPDGLTAALAGQPYWSAPELRALADAHGHAQALAEAYRRYATGLLAHLHGAFVLAVLDPAAGRVFAAIDRIGQLPLYYSLPGEGIVFGSTAASVGAHPASSQRLSCQGLFNYVYFHMSPSPGCIYEQQHKLAGGHYLDYRNGALQVLRYWQPAFDETASASVDELGEILRTLILAAVRRSVSTRPVGAFLSGGLDSSTVAGMLATLHPGQVKTYSIGFAVPGYDEMDYARVAATHFGTEQHEYYLTPADAVAAIPHIAQSYDEPFGNSSALPVYYCAKLAREDGLTRLAAGDGGDELFAGNERYADQQVFEHYRRLPRLLREAVLEGGLRRLSGLRRLPLFRKADSYIQQANTPLPDRLESYNFLHRHAAGEIFTAAFLEQVDTAYPLTLLRELYQTPGQASALNRMLYLDWQRTLHDNDLVKVNRMCQLAGIEVVYPLLDDALVEFSCRVPSAWKLNGRRLRWFYKQAMKDFLPVRTLRKSKHGFGLPFGIWTQTHRPLQELAYDSLQRLKQRSCFRADFIDRAIDLHRREHAAYYGELIWILMMLSLWLDSHA